MNEVELSFSLTKEEAREGLIVSTRQRNRTGFFGRWLSLGKQIFLGLGLCIAAVLISQAFDHPDMVAELTSMLVGASAINAELAAQMDEGHQNNGRRNGKFLCDVWPDASSS